MKIWACSGDFSRFFGGRLKSLLRNFHLLSLVKNGCLRTVYKPHSVQQQGKPCAWAIISLGGMSPRRSMRPTRDWLPPGGGSACGDEQPPAVRRRLRPCLALLPAGVTWPRALLRAPVVFYTTFSPLPPPPCLPQIPGIWGRGQERAAVCFCGPFRQVHASQRFPRPGCYPTPRSMECGLSSTPTTQGRDRPTDLRRFHHNRRKAGSQIQSPLKTFVPRRQARDEEHRSEHAFMLPLVLGSCP